MGQAISIERKALKIRYFEDLSNGFTPRLHLLKVSYPMNDESTLCDAGCFFYGQVAIKVANKVANKVAKRVAKKKQIKYNS